MAQDTFIKADKISSDSGNLTTDGSGNVTANTLTPTATGQAVVLVNGASIGIKDNTGGLTTSVLSHSASDNTQVRAKVGQLVQLQDQGGGSFLQFSLGGKMGIAATGDLFDFSAAQALRKLGNTSTTLKDVIAATTNNWTDTNANQINSCSKITGSTNTAVNHNYAGTLTPTIINTMLGTAGTVIWGTIGTTQGTITMSAAGAYVAQALLI